MIFVHTVCIVLAPNLLQELCKYMYIISAKTSKTFAECNLHGAFPHLAELCKKSQSKTSLICIEGMLSSIKNSFSTRLNWISSAYLKAHTHSGTCIQHKSNQLFNVQFIILPEKHQTVFESKHRMCQGRPCM